MEQKGYSVTILMENWVKKLGFYGISGIKLCGYPSYSLTEYDRIQVIKHKFLAGGYLQRFGPFEVTSDRAKIVYSGEVAVTGMYVGLSPDTDSFAHIYTTKGASKQGEIKVTSPGKYYISFENEAPNIVSVQIVSEKYQTKVVPGQTLNLGNADNKTKMKLAADPRIKIDFFRVKNSWGISASTIALNSGEAGYNDLYMDYLLEPMASNKKGVCDKGFDDPSCKKTIYPMLNFILPPGY